MSVYLLHLLASILVKVLTTPRTLQCPKNLKKKKVAVAVQKKVCQFLHHLQYVCLGIILSLAKILLSLLVFKRAF